ncbi:hypothetical protein GCM10023203_31340 [Actinomycetospora straminea]|uniref:Uncharacterized protein n=1 Tax=Actinomycetospora straminea TaxID=663607 RepID=A0ABP9EIH3_9PSEU
MSNYAPLMQALLWIALLVTVAVIFRSDVRHYDTHSRIGLEKRARSKSARSSWVSYGEMSKTLQRGSRISTGGLRGP